MTFTTQLALSFVVMSQVLMNGAVTIFTDPFKFFENLLSEFRG